MMVKKSKTEKELRDKIQRVAIADSLKPSRLSLMLVAVLE